MLGGSHRFAGRRIRWIVSADGFSYDKLDRLIQADYPAGVDQSRVLMKSHHSICQIFLTGFIMSQIIIVIIALFSIFSCSSNLSAQAGNVPNTSLSPNCGTIPKCLNFY